ncbi:tetratricopeptide repeat protein [Myxosarcina sp. GI1(2024)]
MTTDNREKFRLKFQAGKQALERGKYRLSVENLKAATELVAPTSPQGGEAQIWLVTAYQAANLITEAVALAKQLTNHPDAETRERAKRLLYIIQAPQLSRPKEWMSEIPELASTESSIAKYVTAKTQNNARNIDRTETKVDLSRVDTQDNQFVWFALLITILTVGGLFWFAN